MKNKFTVIANDDALKYQVIESASGEVKYENDSEKEVKTVCGLLNEAFYELLERVADKTTDALKETFEVSDSYGLGGYINKLVFDKEHEATFVSVMSKELALQLVDSISIEKEVKK